MISKLCLIILSICLKTYKSQAVADKSPISEYTYFSEILENVTKTDTESSQQCTLYNSKISKNFDVYKKCLQVADEKSSIAYAACDMAKNLTEILKNCTNKSEFEKKFNVTAEQKFLNLNSSDHWDIHAMFVTFEPYTFPGVREYFPMKYKTGVLVDYIDNYSYYTDCQSFFGDACTWYHQAKLITHFQQKGGVWINERRHMIEGQDMWEFCVPLIENGRFYGIFGLDVIEP